MFKQRGFVGLLVLLITVAIIALLTVKILTKLYRLPAPSGVEGPIDAGVPNQTRSIIDSAKDAKRAIEERSRGI